MPSPTATVAYLALFVSVGFLFLLANLLIGWLVRPRSPNVEKLEVYECGEPAIGSSFVQFDLRFYVIALLFIIFDVEVAFFFPWANVFGKSTQLMDEDLRRYAAVQVQRELELSPTPAAWTEPQRAAYETAAAQRYADLVARKLREMGVEDPGPAGDPQAVSPAALDQFEASVREGGTRLARFSIWDIAVFFGVLMVGFAYVWKRGDLDWVRAVSQDRARQSPRPRELSDAGEPALTA